MSRITRKGLVIGILLLFSGVAFQQGMNFQVAKATPRQEVVRYTIEVCGILGRTSHTVTFTRQQANRVEVALGTIKRELAHATTQGEMVTSFDHAVVVLGEYGLLGGTSVDEAQRLVKRNYQNARVLNLNKTLGRSSHILNDSNLFCLIAGETTETRLLSIVETGCSALCYLLFAVYIFAHFYGHDPIVLSTILTRLQALSNVYHRINSRRIIGTGEIAFGSSHMSELPPPYRYDPAVGWVATQGMLGKKSWNGSFYGGIFGLVTFDSNSYAYYLGATGFLGIKVDSGDGNLFFLGSAFRVTIIPEIHRGLP